MFTILNKIFPPGTGAFFVLFFLPSVAFAQVTGTISGLVRDAKTQEPLIGATILIEATTLGGSTDERGYFKISNIPTKTYTVRASLLGYATARQFDVTLTSGNTLTLNFDLQEQVTEIEDVEVKANFVKPIETVNSIQSLGSTEIAKYPGGNFDIAKVVQSLPGVSGSVGFRNDIIIRGGAPNENVYYLDGVEVPNINHFATQGAAGGPVGMLNVSFIDNVTLQTSSFSPRYDNPLSGVLQFRQRTGNPEKIQGNLRTSASEVALTLEGPVIKKNPETTFLISARRSYLQFIFKLINLPFLPDYWDYQYKITHKPDNKNEISLIGLGSIDNFRFNKPANATLEQLAILEGIPLSSQWTSTVGIFWKHLINKGFWQLTASGNILVNKSDKFENDDIGNENRRILGYRSTENERKLRFEYNKFLGKWSYNFGGNAVWSLYDNRTFQRRPEGAARYQSAFQFGKFGVFGQLSRTLLNDKLTVTAGIRADVNTFTTNGMNPLQIISPRLSASYAITEKFNFNASLGRYFKVAPYTVLGFQADGQFVNRDSRYIESDHYVAGFEFLPTNASRFTLEGFYKRYRNYPVSDRLGISLANLGGDFGVLGNENTTSTGLGRTYGFEATFQQRLTRNFYGILAYTFYFSQFTGFDASRFLPSAWDNRHLVSFTGGYKFPKNWELGLRFRFQGQAPATPFDTLASLENLPFTQEPVLDYSQVNTLRLNAFNAADIRIDKKWNFKQWSLDVFLDVQNFYNSLNPSQPNLTLKRNLDETIATTTGQPYNPGAFQQPSVPNNRQDAIPVILPQNSGSRLPSVGVVVEF
jgi:CarboxypepD_reg-like domain/TonB-dependent Receptor Plug Domain